MELKDYIKIVENYNWRIKEYVSLKAQEKFEGIRVRYREPENYFRILTNKKNKELVDIIKFGKFSNICPVKKELLTSDSKPLFNPKTI